MTPPIVVEVKNSKMTIARNSLKDGVAKVPVEVQWRQIYCLANETTINRVLLIGFFQEFTEKY